MKNSQAAVFAITLDDNIWFVYSDDVGGARAAVAVRLSADSAIANPGSTPADYNAGTLVENAQVEQIPHSISPNGFASINYEGVKYTLVKDAPKLHSSSG